MNFIFKNKKGFTIIELVISIFILSIAVIGIFNALSIITILTSDSADRLTATYLAQEGMEIARNIRDTNWLSMDTAATNSNVGQVYSWVDGLVSSDYGADHDQVTCSDQSPCETDYVHGYMLNGTDYLYLNSSGFYGYDQNNATKTKFIRQIIITPVEDVDNNSTTYHIIKVKVEVSWNKKATVLKNSAALATSCGANNCVTTEETLYNWYNTNISVTGVKIYDPKNSNPGPDPTLITAGDTDQLTAIINPTHATNQNVNWFTGVCSITTSTACGYDSGSGQSCRSNDQTCCPANETCISSTNFLTVDKDGKVTAVKEGSDIPVTVTTSDGQKTYTDYFTIGNKQ